LLIGGIEALSLIAERMGRAGGVLDLVVALNENLTNFGFVIVGVFILAWIASTLIYKMKHYARLEVAPPASS